jgi:hypothetical protein
MQKALSALWRGETVRNDRRASSDAWTLVECAHSLLLVIAGEELYEQGEKHRASGILRAQRCRQEPGKCEVG